jgi:predicted PurR-regulated permease PerM
MQQHLEFVLHPPLWAAVFLVIVGFAVFVIATRRLDRTLGRVGIGLLLLGILAGIVGWFFPSERAQMETRTRDMVAAINASDWQKLQTFIDLQTTLATPSQSIISGKGNITNLTKHVCRTFGVKSVSVYRISSIRTETLITVTVGVYSEQDISQGRPIFSNLQLDFAQNGNDWVLQTITILSVDQRSGDEIANHLR